ncbi:MAG: type II secretion system F family protein [Dehalococcoidales bacterium]|nr:type II secretion system F family protein [Dehalococcoidales bacterium]
MAKTTTALKKQIKPITYRYIASTPKGDVVKGTIKALSEIEAERLIIARGYNPEHVEIAPSMFSLEEALPSLFKVKQRDVIIFSRQLSTLLRSGVSLLPALEILSEQVGVSRVFAGVLSSVTNEIRSGGSFSQAISKHPRVFDDIYCRTIAVAEESGSLVTVLQRMADYMEKQSAIGQKIGKALTYPMIILVAGVVVVIVLITVVMPKLLTMFTAMSVKLPLPTQILIAITNFVKNNPVPLLVLAAVIVVAILYLVKQPTGRRFLDRVRLTAPIIGPPTLMSELGRLARTMSVLIGAGLKLQEIMELLPRSTSNSYLQRSLKRVQEALFLGEGLSEPMTREKILPSLFVQMIAVGEESNTLEFTMGVVADFYETTAEDRSQAMVGMIGPIATISIALLVGFIAISVLMPMYTITGAFG